MSSKRSVDEKRIERIRKMAAEGVSRVEIAGALNMSAALVSKIVNRTGAYAD